MTIHKLPNLLGDLIILYRKHRGLSQAELARRTGASKMSVSKIENGLLGPSPELLVKIENALELNIQSKGILLGARLEVSNQQLVSL